MKVKMECAHCNCKTSEQEFKVVSNKDILNEFEITDIYTEGLEVKILISETSSTAERIS